MRFYLVLDKAQVVAATILVAWSLSLALMLVPVEAIAVSIAIILTRTFCHTGLFIIAHDAMHGSVFPNAKSNRILGQLSLSLYAFLSYSKCRRNHRLHHQFPSQSQDPDFYSGYADDEQYAGRGWMERSRSIVCWYFSFLKNYISEYELIRLVGSWLLIQQIFYWGFGGSIAQFLLYWILPILLSSLQLFLFGTYLPHCPRVGQSNKIFSLDYPIWLSFLSCYHFGYHQAHHQHPTLSWFDLPYAHVEAKGNSSAKLANSLTSTVSISESLLS